MVLFVQTLQSALLLVVTVVSFFLSYYRWQEIYPFLHTLTLTSHWHARTLTAAPELMRRRQGCYWQVDLVGLGDKGGVCISLNNGNETFKAPVLKMLASKSRKIRDSFKLLISSGPTGNEAGDIVGFRNNGVNVGINNCDGTFQPAKKGYRDFAYDAGDWRLERHLRASRWTWPSSMGTQIWGECDVASTMWDVILDLSRSFSVNSRTTAGSAWGCWKKSLLQEK